MEFEDETVAVASPHIEMKLCVQGGAQKTFFFSLAHIANSHKYDREVGKEDHNGERRHKWASFFFVLNPNNNRNKWLDHKCPV